MRIMLSTGQHMEIDRWAYQIFKNFTWYFHKSSKYAATKYLGQQYWFHRVVALHPKYPECVDHINRNRLDNRIKNLRVCLKKDNPKNVSKAKNNTSGYTGVFYHKHNNRWMARYGKKPVVYLGCYKTIKEALAARNAAILKAYGQFAVVQKMKGRLK